MKVRLFVSAVLLAAGCVSRPALVVQTFTIDPPASGPRAENDGAAGAGAAAGTGAVLELGRVRVDPGYAGQALVYRVGPHRVEKDAYARFASPPGGLLTGAIRGYLENADFVADVVSPGAGAPVAARIEVEALDLAGELDGDPAASLTLRFRVVRPAPGSPASREVFAKTYARRVGVSAKTAAAVVAGWNQALAEIMTMFRTDLGAALGDPP